ncbi:MAG: extracellular solute-binding protein [Chloroflexota bacterium]|nr:extracellular solute-binding protein [Chloroflexota bacterium]
MFTRRALLAQAAFLAAGCSFLDSSTEAPRPRQEASLNWAVSDFFASLAVSQGMSALEKYRRAVAELAEDEDNPHGFARGRYSVALRRIGTWPDRDDFAALLDDLEADLVTVGSYDAQALGESGVLLPLDRFSGAEGRPFDQVFYPNVLAQFQRGALYALPVGVRPQVLYYDAARFRREDVPPPDGSWNWEALIANAAKLTERRADGAVARWGLATHSNGLWWALWQNEADVVDLDTLQCRLQEPAAFAALEFFRDLVHTYRVSPPLYRDLDTLIYEWGTPPAMVYNFPPKRPSAGEFRIAAIPRGQVRAVPVYGELGIAIAARTADPDASYRALQGLTNVMQQYVNVPAQKEAVANLGNYRKDLRPEEVAALQQSMEHGHGWPQTGFQYRAMRYLVEALVDGEDVASVVNQACSIVREYQQNDG